VSRFRDAGLFGTLAVFWGLSFPAISVGLETLPPLLFASFRYDVAAILLLSYAVLATERWWPRARNDRVAVLAGGTFLVAGNGLLFIGQQTVPSGAASIMQTLVPIATAVWALLLLGERLSLVGTAGVAVGFLGISLVIQPDPNNLLAGDTVGRLIIVGQVISVALGGVLVERADPAINRPAFTGWSMLLGAVILHVLSLAAGELPEASVLTPTAVGSVLYLGVFSTAFAFLIFFYILGTYGAFEASLVSYLVPIVATVVGVLVLEESINLLTITGFGLVAVGFALLKRDALADAVANSF